MAPSNHRILIEKELSLSQEETTVPARSEKDATADGLEGESRQGTRQLLVPSERCCARAPKRLTQSYSTRTSD